MYLLIVGVCVVVMTWAYPGVYKLIQNAATNMSASMVNNYRNVKRSSGRLEVLGEIFHNYRTGAVSMKTLVGLALFKCRAYSTEIFENGLILDKGDHLEVVYYLRDTRYAFISPKLHGPRRILRIYKISDSKHENDILSELRERLGPYGNFHGVAVTPSMLGFPDGLQILYRKGETLKKYGGGDIISVGVA